MLTVFCKVWVAAEEVQEELQLYAARHTLCGVLTQQDSDALIETKFHVNAEQGKGNKSVVYSYGEMLSGSIFAMSLIAWF